MHNRAFFFVFLLSFFSLPHLSFGENTLKFSYLPGASALKAKIFQAILTNLTHQTDDSIKIEKTDSPSQENALDNLKKGNIDVFISDRGEVLLTPVFESRFPELWPTFQNLQEHMSDEVLKHLTSLGDKKGMSVADITDIFIGSLNWKKIQKTESSPPTTTSDRTPIQNGFLSTKFWIYLGQHIYLSLAPLCIGFLLTPFFAKFYTRFSILKIFIHSLADVFLTIPWLSFLCFLIPAVGRSPLNAFCALTIINLLALLVNPHGPSSTGKKFWENVESALSIAKTQTISNVGMITVAGLVGAGGFGTWIGMGLAIHDLRLLLRGAIGAALLAVTAKWFFEMAEWFYKKKVNVID